MSQGTSQQEIPLRFTSHPDPSIEVASYPNITGFPFSQTWEFITECAGKQAIWMRLFCVREQGIWTDFCWEYNCWELEVTTNPVCYCSLLGQKAQSICYPEPNPHQGGGIGWRMVMNTWWENDRVIFEFIISKRKKYRHTCIVMNSRLWWAVREERLISLAWNPERKKYPGRMKNPMKQDMKKQL